MGWDAWCSTVLRHYLVKNEPRWDMRVHHFNRNNISHFTKLRTPLGRRYRRRKAQVDTLLVQWLSFLKRKYPPLPCRCRPMEVNAGSRSRKEVAQNGHRSSAVDTDPCRIGL